MKYIPAICFLIAAIVFAFGGNLLACVMFLVAAAFWTLGAKHP